MSVVRQQREEKLNKWLDRVNARTLWQTQVPKKGPLVTAYQINGQVALVVALGDGWDLYIPASKSNNIARTLDEAALALGVEGSAGL